MILDRRGILGLLVTLGALTLTTWSIYHLMRTGTCATGGPYVSARPCPPGTGWHVLGMMGSILLGVIGAGLARSAALGITWFGMFFCIIAALFILVGDSLFTAIVFLAVLGLPAVALGLKTAGMGVRER